MDQNITKRNDLLAQKIIKGLASRTDIAKIPDSGGQLRHHGRRHERA